jgi:hypothetical protein
MGAAGLFQRLKGLLTRSPRPHVHHPELGLMTFYSGLWRGQLPHNGDELAFALAGSDAAPHAALVNHLRALLNRFPEAKQSALDFLCAEKRLFNPKDFTVRSVSFFSPDQPDVFGMEFSMEGDEKGLWRVDFEQNQPKHLLRHE